MRTTVTLSDEVSAAVERLRRERGVGVSEATNDLVRRGLPHPRGQAVFRQRTSDLGLPKLGLDDVAGLLDVIEGEHHRS